MAGKFEIRVENLNVVLQKIKKAKENIITKIEEEFVKTGINIESEAKNNAPVNFGILRSSIYSRNVKDAIIVGAKANYAGFVEFGTKSKKKIPAGYEDLAKQRQNSDKVNFEDIQKWAQRKGISQEYVYPIFLSILEKGIKPQPFLVPAIEKHVKILKEKLERL